MQQLIDLIKAHAESGEDSGLDWDVRTNSLGNVRVLLYTREVSGARELAFERASELLEQVLDLGYELGPVSEVSAARADFDDGGWRGRLDVVLWPEEAEHPS